MIFRGMNVANPINRLRAGDTAIAVNIRAYGSGWLSLRNVLSAAILTVGSAVNSIARLNDSTPAGPVSGYTFISADVNGNLYCGATGTLSPIATGMSGHQISLIPFRPNTSVQPWAYTGDDSEAVTITASSFLTNGMLKVRSDGLCYKAGIKEPQLAPTVGTNNTAVAVTGTLAATAIPWTNYSGANSSYSYGETNGYPDPTPDGTAPFVINCQNATSVTITSLTGTATINGNAAATPLTNGPSTASATNPGHYVMAKGTGATPPATASVVIGAFCDGAGNVVPAGASPLYIPAVVDVGASIGTPITVPYGAATFQVGINSTGNTFSSNSGSFTLTGVVTTNALPSVLSIFGNLTFYPFGDSPNSGPVASYIWKNPDDPGGSGPARSISSAVGSTIGNSFIFDATFTAGIPALPGIGSPSVPMTWSQLNPQEIVTGSYPAYSPAIKGVDGNTAYQNFNFCMTGNLYFPAPGHYTFVLTNKDDVIWGMGGGITLVSAAESGSGEGSGVGLSGYGQTKTVVGGYPLLPRENYTHGDSGDHAVTTAVVNVPAAGSYPIEIDGDYWYHSGRIFLLMCTAGPAGAVSSTGIIPPLPIGIRENVSYACKYRSSATGAVSNPGPVTTPQLTPVLANQVSCPFSNDPQVDKVDYYRQDSGLANFTYVATGPNTNPPTAITDALSDLAAANNPTMNYDDFEPVPSIDLPRAGTCNVSGGVITWVSGDHFNVRWLAGTVIEIGSPTQLAYTLIARPTSTTSMTIPGVPDGTDLVWNIAEPKLANQPLPYLFGPTDNINFVFGVGDPLRPGTLYWCKGSNLDSWPDTNQEDVTDPGEALVNGAMSAGRGVLFSIKRAWIIVANTSGVTATVTGTQGNAFTLQATSVNRGLYIPRCVAVEGGGRIMFRVDDGIHLSPAGLGSKSITDQTLYPLFKHEGSTPAPITRNGITVYPPDDTKPEAQSISIVNSFGYYDYIGTDGNPYTLVYDLEAGAWTLDQYMVGA